MLKQKALFIASNFRGTSRVSRFDPTTRQQFITWATASGQERMFPVACEAKNPQEL